MASLLQRLAACRRGAAAVEFALVAPMLIVFHLGVVETVDAWEAHRRVAHIASTLADLTAQNRTVDTTTMNDILQAGNVLITPYASSALQERVASLSASATGVVTLDWSVQTTNWSQSGSPSVPADYLNANESVIVADVVFAHKSIFALVMPKAMTMKARAYLRPRLSDKIPKT